MTYKDTDLSVAFYLKGNDYDILKIVILNTEDNTLKSDLVEMIQEEYILMCDKGISNLEETRELLTTIYDRYTKQGDKILNPVIQSSTLRNVEIIANILTSLDSDNDEIILALKEFSQLNKTILDSVGYDNIDENLNKINHFIGIDDSEIDLEDEDQVQQDAASSI
ncbi:hypothetical protein AAHB94_24250 [Bacillus toyonensis]